MRLYLIDASACYLKFLPMQFGTQYELEHRGDGEYEIFIYSNTRSKIEMHYLIRGSELVICNDHVIVQGFFKSKVPEDCGMYCHCRLEGVPVKFPRSLAKARKEYREYHGGSNPS